MGVIEADFGGWATKVGLRCSDGRTIMKGAFQHQDEKRVPLVYQHGHNDVNNVLGHAILKNYDEGVYAYAFFNKSPYAQQAKELVQHGDITRLSIHANQLKETDKNVVHGVINEVSLVLAGANPGAVIDYVRLQHSSDPDDFTVLDDAAIIHTGLSIDVGDEEDEDLSHDDGGDGEEDMTVGDVYDGFSEEEQNVVQYMIGVALEQAQDGSQTDSEQAAHSAPQEGDLIHQEGANGMPRNVFDQTENAPESQAKKFELSHDDMQGIFADANKRGSLKEAVQNYADSLQHGITDIDVLFPDAKAATGEIELEKRRTEWVSVVLNGTRHTPFSRIKTFTADLTQDEARAKGYIKGNYKEEEWIGVSKRTTSPTTIYKKQKLDRDDILDITDFNIVAFLKSEMRLMTEEEIARAILIGDGRSVSAEDKVKDPLGASDGSGIRSILNDHELFVTTLEVNVDDSDSSYEEVIDAVMDGMEFYKGTGTPTFFTTIPQVNMFKKARDLNGQRYYKNNAEVAEALGVDKIVTVEPMKEIDDLIGIIVNLADYNVGTDRGGELTMFDDFDIDYNQQKYLLETRLSGALIKPKSALIIKKTAAANVLVKPPKPTFVSSTGIVTIPTKTGVIYKDGDGTTLTAGAQTALAAGETMLVVAVADTGYYFSNNAEDSWTFKRPAA